MKKLIRLCSAVMLVTLVAASIGQAAATAVVSSRISQVNLGGLTYSDPWYDAYAIGATGTDYDPGIGLVTADDWDEVHQYTPNGWAEIPNTRSIGNAEAIGQTGNGFGPTVAPQAQACASVAPLPCVIESAYAYGSYDLQVTADGVSDYTVTANYKITAEFITNLLGDSAGGSAEVGIGLWTVDGFFGGEDPLFSDLQGYYNAEWDYQDGDTYALIENETLGFTATGLAAGDYRLWMWADAEALGSSACSSVIPAPGAILLVGLGSGLVGWMRRRKTI